MFSRSREQRVMVSDAAYANEKLSKCLHRFTSKISNVNVCEFFHFMSS